MWRYLLVIFMFLGLGGAALAAPTTPTADFTDNGDGTVIHKTTGLTWKRCAEGQVWSGGTCTGTEATYTWAQATALTSTFAGKGDWRLPNVRELSTIVEIDAYNPAINSTIFPNTPTYSAFWSASVSAGFSDSAWIADFYWGVHRIRSKALNNYVRLVRGGQSLGTLALNRPATDYVDNGDGTVTHTPAALTWKRCAEGQTWNGSACTGTAGTYTWAAASALTSSFAGKSDWRLPTIVELRFKVDFTLTNPSINSTIFPNTSASNFWSASTHVGNSSSAWYVGFGDGDDGPGSFSGNYQVRLVRSGQSAAPSPTLSALTPTCPSTLNASATGSCSATASYSDASSKSVSASWSSSNPSALSVNSSSGSLTAGTPSADTPVTITANYSEGGVSKTATTTVTVKAAAATLTGLTASCPSSVNAGASASCAVNASYSNGTSSAVNASWSSSNSSVATLSGNTVTAGSTVLSDTTVTLTASYTENGITKTATQTVSVKASPALLSSLTASCPSSLNAGGSATCSATASYTNGASNMVNATWTSSNSTVATISGATVTASAGLTTDTPVSLNASYTENGVTKTATAMMSVKAAVALLSGLTASCPSSVNAGATATCSATASYTNNTSNIVNATWTSSDLTAATFSGNLLVAGSSLTTDKQVTLNVSYTENGATKTATAVVLVKAVAPTPTKLLIGGTDTVKSGESANFTATLVYSDGSSKPGSNITWTVSGSGASVDAMGNLTATKVTADTSVTLTAIYSDGQVTKTANQIVTIKMGGGGSACSGTGANLSGITIVGNSLKKTGEPLDVSYCLKSFNSASKFDIYVAVQLPDGTMLFLQTAGFFGTPSFVALDAKKIAAKYLENTLIPDKSGSVLSISVIPLELPTGTYGMSRLLPLRHISGLNGNEPAGQCRQSLEFCFYRPHGHLAQRNALLVDGIDQLYDRVSAIPCH